MPKSRSSIASEHQLALLRQKLQEPEPTSVPAIYRPALSTVTDAAKYFGIKTDTIRKWLQRGKLTAHGHDSAGHALVDKAELAALVVPDLSPEPVPVWTTWSDSGELIAAEDAANLAGVSSATVRGWASRGYKDQNGNTVKLTAVGIDHRRRKLYRIDDVWRAERATRIRGGRERHLPPHVVEMLKNAVQKNR